MIDSGATNSFINTRFLASTAIRKRLKDIPQEIQVIDGRPIASGQVTHHTGPLELEINGHYETLALDITTLGDYPVIIGLPWLARHNPLINWTQQTLVFNSGYCKRNCSKRKYRSKNNGVPTTTTTMKKTSQPIMNGNLPGTKATDTPTNQDNKRCCGNHMSRPDNRVPCKGADHGAATTTTSLDGNSQDARLTFHSIKAVEVRKTIKTTQPTTTRPVPVTPPSSPARLAMARKIALMKTKREKSKPITVALVNGKSFKFSLKDAKVYGITMFNDKGLIDPKPAQDDDGQDLAKDELRKAVPSEFHDIQNNLTTNIEIAQRNQAKYYDRATKDKPHDKDGEPKFKVGSWVFLNRRYIESKRPSKKLDQRLLGPFQIIKETKSPMAYVLDLPPSMSQLHPVFHVSLLEPMRAGHDDQHQDPPPAIEVEGEPEYAVERILDSRINPDDDGFDYLVHWKDYTNDHDSWEPWEEIHDTTAYKTFARQNKYNNQHVFPTTYHKRKQHQKQDSYQPISTTTDPDQLRRSKRIRQN